MDKVFPHPRIINSQGCGNTSIIKITQKISRLPWFQELMDFMLELYRKDRRRFQRVAAKPAFMNPDKFDQVITIANKLKRCKMEELMDFIHQLHKQDRQREAIRKAEARGKKKGKVEAVQDYISAQANISKLNIPEIAAMFKVDEQIIRSMIHSTTTY